MPMTANPPSQSLPYPTQPETLQDVRVLFGRVAEAIAGGPVIYEYRNGPIPVNGPYTAVYADVVDSPQWDTLQINAGELTETVRGQCTVRVRFTAEGDDAIQRLQRVKTFLQTIEAESFYVWPVVGKGRMSGVQDVSTVFRGAFRRSATLSVECMCTLKQEFGDTYPLVFESVEATVKRREDS